MFSSCCSQRQSGISNETQNNNCDKTIAIVRDYRDLDGCKYLLELKDGRFLNPTNLDSNLRKDGTKICIDFIIQRIPSVCMKGEVVELKSISVL
tara:strand:- start:429 stop:710 length:282 start_codon:yes stop_codon:yes gene_type:complete